MANLFGRPTFTRARRRAMRKRQLLIGGGALAALLVIVLAVALLQGKAPADNAVDALSSGGADAPAARGNRRRHCYGGGRTAAWWNTFHVLRSWALPPSSSISHKFTLYYNIL